MEGWQWQWASLDDINALFNYYLSNAGVTGDDLLGLGPDIYIENGATSPYAAPWMVAMKFDGWWVAQTDPRYFDRRLLGGVLSTENPAYLAIAALEFSNSIFETHSIPNRSINPISSGWFYRGVSPQISNPATIPLLAIARAALELTRS